MQWLQAAPLALDNLSLFSIRANQYLILIPSDPMTNLPCLTRTSVLRATSDETFSDRILRIKKYKNKNTKSINSLRQNEFGSRTFAGTFLSNNRETTFYHSDVDRSCGYFYMTATLGRVPSPTSFIYGSYTRKSGKKYIYILAIYIYIYRFEIFDNSPFILSKKKNVNKKPLKLLVVQ